MTTEEGLTKAIWPFLLYQREAAPLFPEPFLHAPFQFFEDLVGVMLIFHRHTAHDELKRDLLPFAEEASRAEIIQSHEKGASFKS